METVTFRTREGRTVQIRMARPIDAEAVNEEARTVVAEGVGLMTETVTRTTEEERRVLEAADGVTGIFLVAEVDGRIVGLTDIFKGKWRKNAHTASLGISVLREYRRQGLGEALLRQGIEWARGAGVRRLKLEVFANNLPALSLYRKLGFVEEGRWKGEVILDGQAVDEILMVRWLPDP